MRYYKLLLRISERSSWHGGEADKIRGDKEEKDISILPVCARVYVSWWSAMRQELRLVEMLKAQKQIEQDNTVDMRENLET